MLLECLAREGVECIFGYPGGVTLPFYDALYDQPAPARAGPARSRTPRSPPRAMRKATGKIGVCCATSGPGATNLVTGLVDAMMDSVPIVALTGQVSTSLIGSDAFQEADTFGITRSGHEAQLHGEDARRTAADHPRGVLSRRQRPPRSGAGRRPEGRLHGARPLRARRPKFTCPATRSSPKATAARSGAPRR